MVGAGESQRGGSRRAEKRADRRGALGRGTRSGSQGASNKKVDKKKKGKRPISRRYNLLPLLPSGPDGVQRELAVWDLPFAGAKARLAGLAGSEPPDARERSQDAPSRNFFMDTVLNRTRARRVPRHGRGFY